MVCLVVFRAELRRDIGGLPVGVSSAAAFQCEIYCSAACEYYAGKFIGYAKMKRRVFFNTWLMWVTVRQ